MTAPAVFDRLYETARAAGCRLFTVTVSNTEGTLASRVYTSHPAEYPVAGTKPMTRDAWYDHVITGLNSFIANTPAAFETVFFDHALITSIGLGSCLNIPIIAGQTGIGTVNFLAEAQHFTPERLNAYHAMTMAEHGALVQAMRPG